MNTKHGFPISGFHVSEGLYIQCGSYVILQDREMSWACERGSVFFFYVHVTVHRNKFLCNKTN